MILLKSKICWIPDRFRRGTALVLMAVVLVIVVAFAAFAIDVGFLAFTKTKLQNAADAASLAAALELNPMDDPADVREAARAAAQATAAANLGQDAEFFNAESDLDFGRLTYNANSQTYTYNWGDQHTPYNMVRVHADRQQRTEIIDGVATTSDQRMPLFFAPALGLPKATLQTTAVATFQPRDIMVVLDFSASMNDDSTFAAISKLGRSAVEQNLLQCYQELGSPTYGNLQFTPQYAVFSGQPASGNRPHIDVTFKGTEIYVSSTKSISSVKLKFSNDKTQTINGSGKTGTFKGSNSNNGKTITAAWVKSGSNGSNGEQFDFDDSDIKSALGLGSYPYDGGSWTSYISYCNQNNGQVDDAGYRWKYGYLTWMQYLLDQQPMASDTADLWKVSAQPLAALKGGVNLFIDYLTVNAAEDRVGLSIYSTSTGAKLEHGLSSNITQVKTTTQQRQAGHYDHYTNIGAGMQVARLELMNNARPKAFRLMVLMTDGLPNRPYNESYGESFTLQEAQLAKDNNIKILTISLGAGADTGLMQDVADITGGLHFNVPGGASISDYDTQLEETFLAIGASRPLRLIADPGN